MTNGPGMGLGVGFLRATRKRGGSGNRFPGAPTSDNLQRVNAM